MGAWQFIKSFFSKPIEKEEVFLLDTLTFSSKGLEFLKSLEGLRLKMYRDPAGYPTIGIGHKLTDKELSTGLIVIGGEALRWKAGITKEQAETLKYQDLVPVENAIRKFVKTTINENQFDALVCLIFNIGTDAFRTSTLLKKINKGLLVDASTEFIRWDKITLQNGEKVRLAALTKRRQKEAELWLE